ncbi:hypothetical protein ABW286_04200 [Erwinia papayae]|uniref:Uncharacterized protein n=1 Tax=Erwinia papayae TaxID=206499 RepID=A0ABV3MXV7_9GAMM
MFAQKENKTRRATNSSAHNKYNVKQRVHLSAARPESVLHQKLQDHLHNSKLSANAYGVMQLSRDIAQRNWRTVNQYSRDQAENVARQFLRAGYTAEEAGRMIVPLIDRLGHGEQVFAHGSGGSDSGTQGDTMERIRSCVNDLLEWVRANPKPKEEKKSADKNHYQGGNGGGKGGKGGKKDDASDGGGDKPIGTGHLASWITGVPAWFSKKT